MRNSNSNPSKSAMSKLKDPLSIKTKKSIVFESTSDDSSPLNSGSGSLWKLKNYKIKSKIKEKK